MNRDNVLFVVIGLLIGFIAGYVSHEVMAARQPPRAVPGQAAAGAAPGAATAGDPAGGAPAEPPAMAEVRALRQRLEEDPNDREALRRLAGLQFQISNWSRAIELFERLLALEPNDVVTMTDLGVSYRGAGQLDRALELFRRAYETDPSYWQAAFNEAYVLGFDRGDWAAAQRVVDELQARQPDNADVARLAEEIARRRQAAPPADGAS